MPPRVSKPNLASDRLPVGQRSITGWSEVAAEIHSPGAAAGRRLSQGDLPLDFRKGLISAEPGASTFDTKPRTICLGMPEYLGLNTGAASGPLTSTAAERLTKPGSFTLGIKTMSMASAPMSTVPERTTVIFSDSTNN